MADVGMWLNHHGFSEEVQECFKSTMPNACLIMFNVVAQEVDGEALLGAIRHARIVLASGSRFTV